MKNTLISWTTHTWNPTFGCSKVSEGCRNCYAETIALKYGHSAKPWTHPNAPENVRLKPHKLADPTKIAEPSRIFVNSMSDLFHELIPDDYIRKVFDVMNQCPQHVFQVLTKRPERAATWTYGWADHIWMGTSVEDARNAGRIDALRQCPAHTKFISAEPLIAPLGAVDLTGLDWVIVGGESGKDRRPMPHAWARQIRDLCLDADIAFFFKQSSAYRTELGTSLHHGNGTFWLWQQWPDEKNDPVAAAPHKYACEPVPAVA